MENNLNRQYSQNVSGGVEVITEVPSRKGLEKFGIISSAIMIAIGLLSIFAPIFTALGTAYLITGGLAVYGASKIYTYIKEPAELRSGWSLADGIISFSLGAFILFEAISGPVGKLGMIAGLSFTAGFLSLFNGIVQASAYPALRKIDKDIALPLLISGIVKALLGFFIITNPVAGWFALQYSWGIIIAVTGAAFLIEILGRKKAESKA